MSLTVLIVEDVEDARLNLKGLLNIRKYDVIDVATMKEARTVLQQGSADIVLLDVQLPDGHGLNLLPEIAQLPVRPPVIIMTSYGRIDMAVEAMQNGAHYFLQKPVNITELEKQLASAEEIVYMRRELAILRHAQANQVDFVVGKSPAMQKALELARRAASARVSVLISGETGTGKEMMARAIHRMVPPNGRKERPFIPLNCAAIQPTLLEAELFGSEPGAFSSADKRKLGHMELADNGILFLDEISSMPLEMQAKILRALDDGSFYRVGGQGNLIRTDVQILAASNLDLPTLVQRGEFRSDLYYRLKVVDIVIPPLRDRKQDIPELVAVFIKHFNAKNGQNIQDIKPKALQALMVHNWPGNIRELRNTIERAMIFCDEDSIDLCHLPAEFSDFKE